MYQFEVIYIHRIIRIVTLDPQDKSYDRDGDEYDEGNDSNSHVSSYWVFELHEATNHDIQSKEPHHIPNYAPFDSCIE